MLIGRFLLTAVAALSAVPVAFAQSLQIITDCEIKTDLALPDREERFQFVIFRDRAGGSAIARSIITHRFQTTAQTPEARPCTSLERRLLWDCC
jgi:hypothetical protein